MSCQRWSQEHCYCLAHESSTMKVKGHNLVTEKKGNWQGVAAWAVSDKGEAVIRMNNGNDVVKGHRHVLMFSHFSVITY